MVPHHMATAVVLLTVVGHLVAARTAEAQSETLPTRLLVNVEGIQMRV